MLAPGTYRLTRDIPALWPDKRKRYDWRSAPVKAGTIFYVGVFRGPNGQDLGREAWTGKYSHQTVYDRSGGTLAESALFGALEPIEQESASHWMRRNHVECEALDVIDSLVYSGKITLQDIDFALREAARLAHEEALARHLLANPRESDSFPDSSD